MKDENKDEVVDGSRQSIRKIGKWLTFIIILIVLLYGVRQYIDTMYDHLHTRAEEQYQQRVQAQAEQAGQDMTHYPMVKTIQISQTWTDFGLKPYEKLRSWETVENDVSVDVRTDTQPEPTHCPAYINNMPFRDCFKIWARVANDSPRYTATVRCYIDHR